MDLKKIICVPRAQVLFTAEELALIVSCGERHYDAACQKVASERFLPMLRLAQDPDPKFQEMSYVEGEFRVFDTAAKILEAPPHMVETPEERTFRFVLQRALGSLLDKLNASYREANGR